MRSGATCCVSSILQRPGSRADFDIRTEDTAEPDEDFVGPVQQMPAAEREETEVEGEGEVSENEAEVDDASADSFAGATAGL